MKLLEKQCNIRENVEISNLSQQKKEETIWCHNQIIIVHSFSHKNY